MMINSRVNNHIFLALGPRGPWAQRRLIGLNEAPPASFFEPPASFFEPPASFFEPPTSFFDPPASFFNAYTTVIDRLLQ